VIKIAITVEAFDAIARTMSLGSMAVEPYFIEKGERTVWLDEVWVDRLGAMRGPGEDYSAVILRIAGRATQHDDYPVGGDTMAGTKVTREQFEILEDAVIHTPTGARFSAYPGRPEISNINWGRAGDLLENGDEYRREDVQGMAAQLLRARING
jgi:hypothetical protein